VRPTVIITEPVRPRLVQMSRRPHSDEWRAAETALFLALVGCLPIEGGGRAMILMPMATAVALLVFGPLGIKIAVYDRSRLRFAMSVIAMVIAGANVWHAVHVVSTVFT
jgi:hypothetical protein